MSVADVEGVDEAALIREVVRGSEQAFRQMYREHSPALFRLALRMTGGSESAAEDVLQEGWWRAVRGLKSFEARSSLRTWLSSIVVRCALERIRWEQRDGEALPEELPPSPDSHDMASKLDLERAFEAMPSGYRTVRVEGAWRAPPIQHDAADEDAPGGCRCSAVRVWMGHGADRSGRAGR
ncbi:MAG: RNA polymerase sigma factor [Gemmatimonadetes bacterium]|nr:RNA polymerase sigma factor [Gemmatimonadota bacterium]